MTIAIPSSEEVRAALRPLTRAQLRDVAAKAEVSFHTAYKIQRGDIKQPNIDTVRALLPHIPAVEGANAAAR